MIEIEFATKLRESLITIWSDAGAFRVDGQLIQSADELTMLLFDRHRYGWLIGQTDVSDSLVNRFLRYTLERLVLVGYVSSRGAGCGCDYRHNAVPELGDSSMIDRFR